jgi:hypothetical protein
MAQRQPDFQFGDGTINYYLKWTAGGVVVGFVVGLVLGLNPFGTMLAGVGVLLVGNGAKMYPRWSKSRGLETIPVGEARAGSATEVVGRAKTGDGTVTAPFSGKECLAYTASVGDYTYMSRHDGSGRYTWQSRWWETDSRSFVVADDTGAAWVDPTDVEFHLPNEYYEEVPEGEEPPAEVAAALGAGGNTLTIGDGSISVINDSQKRRYQEFRLHADDEVFITGQTYQPQDGLPPGVGVAIADGPDVPLFSVSTDTNLDVSGELRSRMFGAIGVGGAMVAVGLGIGVFI